MSGSPFLAGLGAGGSALGVDLDLGSLSWQAMQGQCGTDFSPLSQAQALVQYLEEPLTQVAAS